MGVGVLEGGTAALSNAHPRTGRGLVAKRGLVKVLGRGELTKKLSVTAHSFSKAAQEKIAKAGGKAVLVAAAQAAATAE